MKFRSLLKKRCDQRDQKVKEMDFQTEDSQFQGIQYRCVNPICILQCQYNLFQVTGKN